MITMCNVDRGGVLQSNSQLGVNPNGGRHGR